MKKTNSSDRENWIKAIGKIKKVQITVIAGLAALICVGCSAGGSESDAGADTTFASAVLVEGVFVDSPVEGLGYMTQTHAGITDAEGRFTCFEGEMISFMLGDVMLGQAIAGEVITPMDFLDESEMPFDVTHPMITNMGRFLQSLDSDGDPENGITISPEVREEMTGRMIDFHQSIGDFENDPDVVACFDVFNGLNMPHNGMMWDLFSTDEAREHMMKHMGEYMGGYIGPDSADDSVKEFEHPMGEYMDEQMEEIMDDHMDDHMGFDSSDGSGSDFEYPMDEFMNDEMIDYMNGHMGFGSPEDSDRDFDHPMGEQMEEYMESRMGGDMGSRM
jgi:hypothetical protein